MRDWPNSVQGTYSLAIFLDRDGTINVDTGYPHCPKELKMISHATKAICMLSRLPAHLIIVTNQSGIAMNYYSHEEMSEFNAAIRHEIEAAGGRIDAFYYAPFPDAEAGPSGTLHETVKPNPGMLREAAFDFGIDLTSSYMIGDKTTDIAAGLAVGCKTVLVQTGKGGDDRISPDTTPDWTVPDLLHACRVIVNDCRTR